MPKDNGKRPEDLISAKEAGKMAGKSKATIRLWVRENKLTGYRKDPEKKNSTLMVSQEELRAYLAINGKLTSDEVGRPSELTASLLEKDNQIKGLEEKLKSVEEIVKSLQKELVKKNELTSRLEIQLDSRDSQIKSFNNQLEQTLQLLMNLQEEKIQLSSNYHRLTAYVALPWWRKMTSSLLLEDKS